MSPETVLDGVNNASDGRFSYEGRCPGGEVGAYSARGPDGARYVFKWSEERGALEHLTRVAGRVNGLRACGYPAPAYLTPVAIDGATVVLQERVEGAWSDHIDAEVVSTVLRLNDLQSGQADTGGEWTAYIAGCLVDGAEGYCLHQPLRRWNAETRGMIEWIESVGASLGDLPTQDIVHIDFHHRNLLRSEDRLTVVDWEGCRAGDRAFDLVTFGFGCTHANGDPAAFEPLWERAGSLTSPDALRAYVAYMALRRLDWSIRHHPEEVDTVIAVALDAMRRFA